jgi:hypothetical protein
MDRIGLRFFGTNSCVDAWYYKMAIYSDEGNYPKNLLTDFGTITIDCSAPPSVGPLELTGLSQVLTGNTLYWLAIGVNQNAGTDVAAGRTPFLGLINGDFYQFRKRGMTNAAAGTDGVAWLEQVNTFAASFPSSTSYSNVVSSTGTSIRPHIRRSA